MFIHNTKPRIIIVASRSAILRLNPGVNEITPEAWAKVQNHPMTAALISAGHVVLPKPVASEGEAEQLLATPASSEVEGLSGYSNKEATQLVRDTVDIELLDKWLGCETRRIVRDAITRQIEKLKS